MGQPERADQQKRAEQEPGFHGPNDERDGSVFSTGPKALWFFKCEWLVWKQLSWKWLLVGLVKIIGLDWKNPIKLFVCILRC